MPFNAGAVVVDLESNDKGFKKGISGAKKSMGSFKKDAKKFKNSLKSISVAFVAVGAAVFGAKKAIEFFTDASNQLTNSLTGLGSIAGKFLGEDAIPKAQKAAQDLAADGLIPVKDAADGLKNLLATGFSLDEATNLMIGFKDAAAFNRQGTLQWGEAIVGATQGIKNQNSILVDNAGITKNLSLILKDAGLSVTDLGKVTSDTTVRTALYNGLLEEMNVFQGDAATASETLTGKQAALGTQVFNLKAQIGGLLTPAMTGLTAAMSETIGSISTGIQEGGKFRAMLQRVHEFIKPVIDAVRSELAPAFRELMVELEPFMPFIIEGFKTIAFIVGVTLIGAIKGLVKGLAVIVRAISAVIRFIKSLNRAVADLIERFTGITDIGEKIKGFGGTVRNFFGGLTGRAGGGIVQPGETTLVGEQGPEIVKLPAGSNVIPSAQSQDILNSSVSVSFGDVSVRSDQDITSIANEVSRVLGRDAELEQLGLTT